MKALLRVAIRVAYRLMRLRWQIAGGTARGVCVVIRYDARILLVQHSYRPGFELPGGNLKPGEDPVLGAIREMREELGLRIEPGDVRHLCDHDYRAHNRAVSETLLLLELDAPPRLVLDQIEVVGAEFFDPGSIQHPMISLERALAALDQRG